MNTSNLSSVSEDNKASNMGTRLQSLGNSGSIEEAGLSELKYYIVELMKDQNEIRQIVKDLRDLLEKDSEN